MYGRCYDGDGRAAARGSWCAVNASSCPAGSYRAHGDADQSYDYCQVVTVEGCYCSNRCVHYYCWDG